MMNFCAPKDYADYLLVNIAVHVDNDVIHEINDRFRSSLGYVIHQLLSFLAYFTSIELKTTLVPIIYIYAGQTYVAVPGRNQTLFHCVFRPHYRVQSAVAQNFR